MPISHDELLKLATARSEARIRKDFKEADRLREKIEDGGYWIQDADNGGYSFGEKVETVSTGVEVSTLKPMGKPTPKK
jgi:hypothetical protein